MNKILTFFLVVLLSSKFVAQENPMIYQKWNRFDINKVSTEFNNTGLLCNGNQQSPALARQPSFEYPTGSGLSWGTAVGVAIGAPINQQAGAVGGYPNPDDKYYAFCDATIDEGPAAYWDEEHFFPYRQFVNGPRALMSDDKETWPTEWPTVYPLLNDPILYDAETGWPGFGIDGKQLADQESFSVLEAWGGTDQLTSVGESHPNFLKTQMIVRGMAWEGTLYEDFIVWVYIVRNIGTAPITDMRAAIHADFSFLPQFYPGLGFDDDRHYYDPKLQLAFGSDDNGYEESPFGGTIPTDQIPFAGVVALKMPGPSKKVEAYDAYHFWMQATTSAGNGARSDWYYKFNVENLSDPQDSDKDGIDDDFDENGIADILEGGKNYYLGLGADGIQNLTSGKFTLQPGESDTLIFATVFGTSEKDIKGNARRAISLYNNNWEVIDAPPAPVVEAIPQDGRIQLVWGNKSEKDPQFQGYKIYRSSDNGITWGTETFNDFEGGVHYVPLRQYDLDDGITGNYKTLPEFAWFNLGMDQWDQLRVVVDQDSFKYFDSGDTLNMFFDNDVINGVNYRYYVAAYDSGNGITGPLENGFNNNPNAENNTVSVVAHSGISKNDLDMVKVVPNPYYVAELWEQGIDDHNIQFINLPNEATIRIFNSSGELIKTILHSISSSVASSIEVWDMKNEFNQLTAPGVYFYHIQSVIGVTTGKFFIVL